jgi:hypothetical protein
VLTNQYRLQSKAGIDNFLDFNENNYSSHPRVARLVDRVSIIMYVYSLRLYARCTVGAQCFTKQKKERRNKIIINSFILIALSQK